MTLFGGSYFFFITIGLAIPTIILGCLGKSQKYYGFIVSLWMIYMTMGDNPRAIMYLAAYCIIELAIVKLYLWMCKNDKRSLKLYYLFIILSLTPLVIWKVTAFTGVGKGIFAFIGLSYMSFKSIQMIIEIYDGLIKEVSVFEFLYFLIFFPSLLSGPIERSRDFHRDLTVIPNREEYLDMLGDGILKVCQGMIYKFALAAGLYQSLTWLGREETLTSNLIYMYSYGGYLFFDFAGYSLMAVGIGYIFGIRLPDNFRKPFLATDMKDFWDRWHISLSYWFRDFLFSRFMMKAIKGKWFKNRLTGASIGFIINMGVMGVWHGLDLQYILYGLYHGVLLAITEIYQKKSKFHKKHKKETLYKLVSWFITINLVFFGFLIFSGKFGQLFSKG
ncbi:MAG: D-alanyl-lipoteichoic acid biosynthesis protein DltB [Eubacterium sp.]|nr:D-alanyl-lipoteichoic acid biosynthesis protein DltB [Eubacterium sp.]